MLFGLPSAPVLGDLLNRGLMTTLARRFAPEIIERIFAPNPVPPNFAAFTLALALRAAQLRANAEDLAGLNPCVARLSPHYGRIASPVEIVAGDADQIVDPAKHAVPAATALQYARLTLLAGIGHMPHHVAPERVGALIDRLAGRAP
jgi:pimeloyl-ACP methyl ester carboxylesterase